MACARWRKRERAAKAAAKATDADNPHELSETSPENRFIPAEGRRVEPALRAGRRRRSETSHDATGDQSVALLLVSERGAARTRSDELRRVASWQRGVPQRLDVDYYAKYIDGRSRPASCSACSMTLLQPFFYKRLTECMGKSGGRDWKSLPGAATSRCAAGGSSTSRRTGSCRSASRSTGRSPSSAGRARSRTSTRRCHARLVAACCAVDSPAGGGTENFATEIFGLHRVLSRDRSKRRRL